MVSRETHRLPRTQMEVLFDSYVASVEVAILLVLFQVTCYFLYLSPILTATNDFG